MPAAVHGGSSRSDHRDGHGRRAVATTSTRRGVAATAAFRGVAATAATHSGVAASTARARHHRGDCGVLTWEG